MGVRVVARPINEEWLHDVKVLTLQGKTVPEIAEKLGMGKQTVHRYRVLNGMDRKKTNRRFTEDEATWAKTLLDEGCSYAEVARTLGCSRSSLRKRWPGMGMSAGRPWLLS